MAQRKKAASLSIRDLDAKAAPHKSEGGGDNDFLLDVQRIFVLFGPSTRSQVATRQLQANWDEIRKSAALRPQSIAPTVTPTRKRKRRGPKRIGMSPDTRKRYEKWEQMRDGGMTLEAIAYQASVGHSAVSNGLRKLRELRQAEALKSPK